MKWTCGGGATECEVFGVFGLVVGVYGESMVSVVSVLKSVDSWLEGAGSSSSAEYVGRSGSKEDGSRKGWSGVTASFVGLAFAAVGVMYWRERSLRKAALRRLEGQSFKGRNWKDSASGNPYEEEKSLNEYLGMHYGNPVRLVSFPGGPQIDSVALNYPTRCAQACVHLFKEQFKTPEGAVSAGVPLRALDVGCAVGRSTFELARVFIDVVGVDYSRSFIKAALQLRQRGSIEFPMFEEGDIFVKEVAQVDPSIDTTRTTFIHGDACELPLDLGQFGVVLAANLLCRLPKPIAFLERLRTLIVPGGFLVMPSPYTWLEQYTEKKNWIGGYYDRKSGKPVKTIDRLKEILSPDFELLLVENWPFYIRETGRKSQWTIAEMTIWRRRMSY